MIRTLSANNNNKQDQLSFMDVIYAFEGEETKSLKELSTFIKALRYLKVNTLLYDMQSASSGVLMEKKASLLLELAATIEYILTDRQGGMVEYVKSRQDVTVYADIIVSRHDLYVNVSRLRVPELFTELNGIISVCNHIEEILKELKNDLQDRER